MENLAVDCSVPDPWHFGVDPDPDPAIFVIYLQDSSKKLIFSACYFLKVHLHYFSKIKSLKESQNSRIQGFSYCFCMMIVGSGSRAGSGSIHLTSGSGSGRSKNMWIRIQNTGWLTDWLLILSRLPVRTGGYPALYPPPASREEGPHPRPLLHLPWQGKREKLESHTCVHPSTQFGSLKELL